MSIEEIVDQAIEDGCLTPTMEAMIGRICDTTSELSAEEYMALDQLMAALLNGQVTATPRKQFINVMEELVLSEAITQVAAIEASDSSACDLGDIAAYALNRLPPLYATTEEGANYQHERAFKELKPLISQKVNEALSRNLERPDFFPERQPLGKTSGGEVLLQLSSLLQTYAPHFEMVPGNTYQDHILDRTSP